MMHAMIRRTALGAVLAVALFTVQTAAADWGTVSGQVVYDAKTAPKLVEAKVDKDKAHCLSKGKIFTNEIVVNAKNMGVANCLVWLEDVKDEKKAIPVHPALKKALGKMVEVDQPCCQFEPRIVGMVEGQVLRVKNSAPIVHNVDIKGGADGPTQNTIIPANGGKLDLKDIKARRIPIIFSCSIHGWMKGYIGVFKTPYFAVTDKDGKFTIKNAPAGKYRILVWQEKVGWVIHSNNYKIKGKIINISSKGTDLGKIKLKDE